jgi:hypothetical protein
MKITSSIHFVVILTLGTWFSSNSGVIPRNKSNSMGFSWEFMVKCAEKIGILWIFTEFYGIIVVFIANSDI